MNAQTECDYFYFKLSA